MASRYFAEANDTADATLAVGTLQSGSTARRLWLYDVMFGSEAAAADNPFLWVIDRVTGAATGTALTEEDLDEADPTATAVALENITTNPTIGNRVFAVPLNQRASFRWVASPNGALVVAATANNGFAFRVPTSSAVAVTIGFYWEE